MNKTPTAACGSSHLDRVEVAIPIEWEADDVRGVMVPSSIDGVAHDVTDFREHVLNQGLVSAERDSLAQVGRDAHHQALARTRHPAQLLVLAPALQLGEHGLQLEVACLLVQQTVVLQDAEQSVGMKGLHALTVWKLKTCLKVLLHVVGFLSADKVANLPIKNQAEKHQTTQVLNSDHLIPHCLSTTFQVVSFTCKPMYCMCMYVYLHKE